MIGRPPKNPSDFDPEIIDQLLMLVAMGSSMRGAIDTLEKQEIQRDPPRGVPDKSIICVWWMEDREGFAPKWKKARESCYECRADEMIDIADDIKDDILLDKDGKPKFNQKGDLVLNPVAARSREIRLSQRRWELERMLPKAYGRFKAIDPGDGSNAGKMVVVLDSLESKL